AAARRITSATGSVPVMRCPVGSDPPGASAFRRRSSIGSMSSAAASLSIWASCAKHTWTAPNPRIAPHGGLLVYVTYESMRALGTSYGPAAKHAAFEQPAVELEA